MRDGGGMQDPARLDVWRKADDFAVDVVRAFTPRRCRTVPGLRGQVIRAAMSVPDTIAEGCGKSSRREQLRFYDMALTSSAEARQQIKRAARLGVIPEADLRRLDDQVDEIRRMLVGLCRSIRRELDDPKRSAPRRRPERDPQSPPDT